MSLPDLLEHWESDIFNHIIVKKDVFGRYYTLGRWVLVLVGLLAPLVLIWDQNFARTVEITM
jgi:hypothetical protein